MMPNNGKTTNHLQAKGNEATNSLQQENLLRSNLKATTGNGRSSQQLTTDIIT